MNDYILGSSRKQGDIGVAEAILYYTKLGYEIYHPLTEATRADLIVVRGKEILRVQCKTSSFKRSANGGYEVSLVTSGGSKSYDRTRKFISKDEVDVVFAWCSDDSIWVFPSEKIEGKAGVRAGWKNIEYCVRGKENFFPPSSPKKKVYFCKDCENEVSGKTVLRCRGCEAKSREGKSTKIDWLPDADLINKLKESNYLSVSKEIGVSDNAIRKHLKKKGYDTVSFEKT